MDVQHRLDEIVATVEGARSMPMSASCVVNRAELLAQLDEVRQALPGSLAQAQELLGGREQMVADAQQEARRIVDGARTERDALVSDTQVAWEAREEAERVLTEARGEAERIRAEADDYVDSKLANFEVVLSKTIGSVERGRERFRGAAPGAEGADGDGEDYATRFERTADPEDLRRRADEYVDARLASVAAVLAKTLDAVGRGRQKLVGHHPTDELDVRTAAQEDTDGWVPHQSDADYLAELAPAGAAPPAAPEHPPTPEQPSPPVPEYAPAQPAGFGGQAGSVAFDADQAPPAAYAAPQQRVDPYTGWQPGAEPGPGYQGQRPTGEVPGPPAALDETSLFDTSMIDLNQVRQYEQGSQDYGAGYGQGGHEPAWGGFDQFSNQFPGYGPGYGTGYDQTYGYGYDGGGYDSNGYDGGGYDGSGYDGSGYDPTYAGTYDPNQGQNHYPGYDPGR